MVFALCGVDIPDSLKISWRRIIISCCSVAVATTLVSVYFLSATETTNITTGNTKEAHLECLRCHGNRASNILSVLFFSILIKVSDGETFLCDRTLGLTSNKILCYRHFWKTRPGSAPKLLWLVKTEPRPPGKHRGAESTKKKWWQKNLLYSGGSFNVRNTVTILQISKRAHNKSHLSTTWSVSQRKDDKCWENLQIWFLKVVFCLLFLEQQKLPKLPSVALFYLLKFFCCFARGLEVKAFFPLVWNVI